MYKVSKTHNNTLHCKADNISNSCINFIVKRSLFYRLLCVLKGFDKIVYLSEWMSACQSVCSSFKCSRVYYFGASYTVVLILV